MSQQTLFLISAVFVVSVLGIGVLTFVLTRNYYRRAWARSIQTMTMSLEHIRNSHPDVTTLSRGWNSEDWINFYGSEPRFVESIRYQRYVSMGLETCNWILTALHQRQISKKEFVESYGPWIRSFLTDNWPVIAPIHSQEFLPEFVHHEIDRLSRSGWDWAAQHRYNAG